MKIQYLGHSCFRLISQMNTAILTDPYEAAMMGFAMPKVSCDVVTISHHHCDHDCVEEVAGAPAVLEGDVRLAADDISIESLPSFHDDKKGKLRGKNTVFCFAADGLRIVHMGDIGERDEALAAKLRGCDVLLLPVGGVYTVDADGANWYVEQIRPKIVIPMHYKTPQSLLNIDTADKFLALQNPKNVHRLDSETLNFDNLAAVLNVTNCDDIAEPQIVVLEPFVE